MSHDSIENPFPFYKFERDLPAVNQSRGGAGARQCQTEEARRRRWSGEEASRDWRAPLGGFDSARDGLWHPGHMRG